VRHPISKNESWTWAYTSSTMHTTMRDIPVEDGLELVVILSALKDHKETLENREYIDDSDDIEILEDKIEEIGNRKLIMPN